MSLKIYLPFCFFFLVLLNIQLNAQIQISECMASNSSTVADSDGDFDDWVEIFNASNQAIDLAGYYFSDDPNDLLLSQIPSGFAAETTIPAKGYLVLWFDKEPDQGPLHINAKLSSGGENLFIMAPDGVTLLDRFEFEIQHEDVSYGLVPGGGVDFFVSPTPGAANTTTPGLLKSTVPAFSKLAGRFTSAIEVEMLAYEPQSKIYYTTDGREPTSKNEEYNDPLIFDKTTVLRARSYAPGRSPSKVVTHTYFVQENSTFPLVSLAFSPETFFDSTQGLYINYQEDIEVPAHLELFDQNASNRAFGQDFEVEIQGSASADNLMKSLEVKAKAALGSATLNFPLFDDVPLNQYTRFVLRNSGQDFMITQFRDALATSLVKDLSDISVGLRSPDLDLQAYRPSNVFFNGEYWGIHNIRERANEHWVNMHNGWEESEFDMIENIGEARTGTDSAWFALQAFLENNSFVSDANFAEIEKEVDVDHYIDYLAHNLYLDNYDWPGNNIRRYRHRTQTAAKWRWLTYDLDFTFGLYQPWAWNTGDPQQDALWRLINPYTSLTSAPNPNWSTLLFRRMWENEKFRIRFANRFADLLNTTFDSQRVIQRIDAFEALYAPEINRHYEKWFGSPNLIALWEDNVDIMRRFSNERTVYVRNHVAEHLGNGGGYVALQFNVEPQNAGTIEINTIQLSNQNLPWTGTYFANTPVPVHAKAAPGYVFSHWSDPTLPKMAQLTLTPSYATQLTAHFVLAGTNYCTSGSTFPWHEWISEVNIAGSSFPSGKGLNQSPIATNINLESGTPYEILVKVAYSYYTEDVYINAWVDIDGNNAFDAGESILQKAIPRPPNGSPFLEVKESFTLPKNGINKQALLRISMQRGAYAEPCDLFTYGEVEEYRLQLDLTNNINKIEAGNTVQYNLEDLPDFWVYPNPTFDRFEVQLQNYLGESIDLELTTPEGKMIEQRKFEVLNKAIQMFDFGDIEAGVYFLKIKAGDNRTQVRKIVLLER